MNNSDIGIYGLGVMGCNLALNFNDKGFNVSVYNHNLPGEEEVVDQFIAEEAFNTDIRGFNKIKEFITSLKKPRKVLLVIKSGSPVDSVIEQLIPIIDKNDIIIDGGNSLYTDTNRRIKALHKKNILYVGMGISGGEEGARFGPSLMPGGNAKAWPELQPILKTIAASAPDGSSCCSWMGDEGAGHFVKMVHNGIEYAIMQLIAECYHIMKGALDISNKEIAITFDSLNTDFLNSYLLEITSEIVSATDKSQNYILNKILDCAGQKGTGRWTAITALDFGIPLPLITEAVFARTMSSFKELRGKTSEHFNFNFKSASSNDIITKFKGSLLASQSIAFAEGFWLIKAANKRFGWEISVEDVTKVWEGGCILRSALLQPIAEAFENDSELSHLLLTPFFKNLLESVHKDWRDTTCFAINSGIPVPAMLAALSHFDVLRTERLPANLIQAQRDYFGGHKYERIDQPKGTYFHTNWHR